MSRIGVNVGLAQFSSLFFSALPYVLCMWAECTVHPRTLQVGNFTERRRRGGLQHREVQKPSVVFPTDSYLPPTRLFILNREKEITTQEEKGGGILLMQSPVSVFASIKSTSDT